MRSAALFFVTAALIVQPVIAAEPGKVEAQRNEIRKTRDNALAELYQKRPDLKDAIEHAAGYGVFNNTGVQVAVFGGGGGRGLVVENTTGKEHFMRMTQVTLGFGLGVKDLRAIFIFHDAETLNKFVYSGWEFGSNAEASAKSNDKGGAADKSRTLQRGLEIYQLTQSGVSASATVGGTKYSKDKNLNQNLEPSPNPVTVAAPAPPAAEPVATPLSEPAPEKGTAKKVESSGVSSIPGYL